MTHNEISELIKSKEAQIKTIARQSVMGAGIYHEALERALVLFPDVPRSKSFLTALGTVLRGFIADMEAECIKTFTPA